MRFVPSLLVSGVRALDGVAESPVRRRSPSATPSRVAVVRGTPGRLGGRPLTSARMSELGLGRRCNPRYFKL